MRLSGLATGIDTDEMVRSMMQVERLKVNRFTQRKQVNLWRQEQYNVMNKNIANFILNSKRNMGLNQVSSTGSIKNSSYKNLDYVKKAVSYDESVATAKTIGSSANGKFEVTVEELAKDATFTSEAGLKDSTKLKEDIKINGQTIKAKGRSVKDVLKDIESNEELKEMGVTAFLDKNTGRIFIQGSPVESEGHLEVEGLGTANIKDYNLDKSIDIEGKLKEDITINGEVVGKKGQSIEEFKDAFEAAGHGEISIDGNKVKVTGKDLEIKVGTEEIEGKNIKDGAISKAGNRGKATINGVEFNDLTSNTLKFNGLEIEMKSVGSSTIEVSTNTEGIMDKIKGLVNEYNDLLDQISTATSEKRYSSYHPLSAEEKKEMTESDVKLWEEKAKSGMLNNDETLNKALQNVRNDLYKNVEGLEGSFKNITELGITTMKYEKGAAGGKLQIDESKLRAAIEEDADGVMELLFSEKTKGGKEDGGKSNIGSSDRGIFTGIYDNLIGGMQDIISKSGPGEDASLLRNVKQNILMDFVTTKGSISDIDKAVDQMDKEIANMERLLAKREETYYAQFAAMEKQMYEMNSQSDWLMQQMM